MKFVSNLNVRQKELILVLVPVTLQLISVCGLVYLMLDAEHQIKELDEQRDVLLQLQKAASTASQLIFAVRELPRGSDPAKTIRQMSQIRAQLRDDKSFEIASSAFVTGTEAVVQADALRQSLLRLIDRSEIYLRQNGSKKSRHITFMRNELFSTGIAFQNLSESIVQLEKSAKELAPATLQSLQTRIEYALIAIIVLAISCTVTFVYIFVIHLRRRLGDISGNMQALALNKELETLQYGTDEIAQLDTVLHDTEDFIQNARRQKLVILDNAAEIVCAVDTRLKILSINPAVERLWHYEQEDLVGKSLVSLSKEIKSSFDTIKQREESAEFESDITCGDGVMRIFAWSVSWSPEDHTYACIARDVTAIRQSERLRQNFIAVLSHDLRTPITSLGVSLSLLAAGAKGTLPPAIGPDLRLIESKVQGLTELIKALLELDKLESGQLNLQLETLHVYNILAAARERVTALCSSRGITIDGPDADGFIEGDSKRLIDALTCLLSFSIARSGPGGTVKLAVKSENFRVTISVIDSGAEINLDDQQLLFERYHAPSSLSAAGPLGNLSLCIARAIVQNHGGILTVASHKGNTTFCVSLPGVTGGAQAYGEEDDL